MSSSSTSKRLRLERIISNRGVGSRKEIQALLKQGRVSINSEGTVVRCGAHKYDVNVKVFVDGVVIAPIPLLACYHKPVGVVSTMSDGRWGRENLATLKENWPFLKSMHPVGRLDMDTSGLLLFSSNGQLTNTLLHPSTRVEREYEAIVVGKVEDEELRGILDGGVKTTDGTFSAKLLESKVLKETVVIPRSLISKECDEGDESGGAGGAGSVETDCSYVKVSVQEGKYRMVRRILHNSAGHSVINLHRIRYGGIHLEDLEEGEVRPISDEESMWASGLL
jgi:23S rRNA pseudouridine2605 synthase